MRRKVVSLMMVGFLAVAGREAKADQVTLPESLQNSEWEITEWRSASNIFSGGGEERANAVIGKTILLHETSGTLEDGKECPIKSIETVELTDGRMTFGSAGGSWATLGFVKKNYVYPVNRIVFTCAGGDERQILYSEDDDVFVRADELEWMLKRTK